MLAAETVYCQSLKSEAAPHVCGDVPHKEGWLKSMLSNIVAAGRQELMHKEVANTSKVRE